MSNFSQISFGEYSQKLLEKNLENNSKFCDNSFINDCIFVSTNELQSFFLQDNKFCNFSWILILKDPEELFLHFSAGAKDFIVESSSIENWKSIFGELAGNRERNYSLYSWPVILWNQLTLRVGDDENIQEEIFYITLKDIFYREEQFRSQWEKRNINELMNTIHCLKNGFSFVGLCGLLYSVFRLEKKLEMSVFDEALYSIFIKQLEKIHNLRFRGK